MAAARPAPPAAPIAARRPDAAALRPAAAAEAQPAPAERAAVPAWALVLAVLLPIGVALALRLAAHVGLEPADGVSVLWPEALPAIATANADQTRSVAPDAHAIVTAGGGIWQGPAGRWLGVGGALVWLWALGRLARAPAASSALPARPPAR